MSFNMWKHHGLKDREKIAKAYLVEGSTSDLNAGGRLDPEVQEAAFQFMRAQSTLLSPKLSAQWQPQGPSAGPVQRGQHPHPLSAPVVVSPLQRRN